MLFIYSEEERTPAARQSKRVYSTGFLCYLMPTAHKSFNRRSSRVRSSSTQNVSSASLVQHHTKCPHKCFLVVWYSFTAERKGCRVSTESAMNAANLWNWVICEAGPVRGKKTCCSYRFWSTTCFFHGRFHSCTGKTMYCKWTPDVKMYTKYEVKAVL